MVVRVRHRRSPSGVELWAEHPTLVESIRRKHVANGHNRCVVCTTSTGGHVRWPCSLAETAEAATALLVELGGVA